MTDLLPEARSDGVPQKLRLLESACAAGNFDLAMSLADSIRGTLELDRCEKADWGDAQSAADHFVRVADMPTAWTDWARGWSFCKPVGVFETVGIERRGEPVHATVAFRTDQVTDLAREVRVSRVDESTGSLRQVPCQVDDERRRGPERRCRLTFFADVPAHGQATYLVCYGNPYAELSAYTTDLHARGEGYGLDIENHHYIARLSRQMGQLERLTYKREHGLELFAGGKGHGEPPTIDWAHDYVDPGHFQKLRMRNWPRCPNAAVSRGPLCVRVRRWGFPYSPIHPVFTPSRMHVDITYEFYAGLPYFCKQGRMHMVQDFEIEAMRDDEWVFSGYSFSDTVWIDAQGRLHEGAVPAEAAQNLWGVGYFHRQSRDAFIALWLEHTAEKTGGPDHSGAPTLHYRGHGQVWSRYPAQRARFPAGATIRQRNAYLVLPYPETAPAARIEQLRHQLLNPLAVRPERLPGVREPRTTGALARTGEHPQSAPLKPAIWKALHQVRDEQLYQLAASIVDLGYVYDVRIRDGIVTVVVTMPHRGRPVYEFLVTQGGGRVDRGIRERVMDVAGVRDVVVEFTWDPAWTTARLSDPARRELGLPV
jgi:metal-sulfur cluster biosynthetic enzyme